MLQVIPGDDQALRSRAAQLSAGAASIQTIIDQARSTEQQANAGSNPVTSAVASALQHQQTILDAARDVMQQAGQYLNQLANELEQIDAEAVQQRRQVESQPGSAFLELTYLEPFTQRANQARSAAASQLSGLTDRAPGLPHAKHHSFLGDVWDGTIGSILSGLKDLGKGLWDLTGQALYDSHAAERSWANTIHDVEYIAGHKEQFGDAVWNSLIESDLRHRDLPAWIAAMTINVASLFVGIGEAKGALKGLLDSLKAGQAGDTAKLLSQYPNLASVIKVLPSSEAGIWNLQYFVRGFKIEDLVAAMWKADDTSSIHLYPTHPGVDLWNLETSTVTSVKSIDPALPTYANNPSKFASTIDNYAAKLQKFTPETLNRDRALPSYYQNKELVVALPSTGMTPAQASKMSEIVAKYSQQGINITIVEVKR